MARIRSIKPELLEDEKVARLTHLEYRVFVSSFLLADDYGNFRAAPERIHGSVLWAHPREGLAKALERLAVVGLLVFYMVADQLYIHIAGWEKHQKVDHPGKPLCPIVTADSRLSREALAKILDPLAPDQDQDHDLEEGPRPGSGFSPVSERSDPGSDARTRSTSRADFGAPHQPARLVPVGLFTIPFLDVFDRYPRKDAKQAAAVVFSELAADYPGGEVALSKAIVSAFDAGMLKRHPYHGRNATRPMLDKLLAERRWEDPPSAPDDAETPREPFAVQSERRREDAATDAKLERIRDELKPKAPRLSPREEYLRKTGGAA